MRKSIMCCFGKSRKPPETDDDEEENENGNNVSDEDLQLQPQIDPADPQLLQMLGLMSEEELRERLNGYGQAFPYEELSAATENFHQDLLLGRGGFGLVYKGFIERIQQAVAIKKHFEFRPSSSQGDTEFVREVITLSKANHPNLVELLGYCAEGHRRLLVYEYLPLSSLDKHLFDPEKPVLDWNTRMKIAYGAAKGLEYLHNKMDPPIIYRDMKSANVLLDDTYEPKLSDFGLAREGPTGDTSHVFCRTLGTEGYASPNYWDLGRLTLKSDIYSFGVLLFEIITGRKAFDRERDPGSTMLVEWARSLWDDEENFKEMVDPRLGRKYPEDMMKLYFIYARQCVHPYASARPTISEIRSSLSEIASQWWVPKKAPPDEPETSRAGEMRGRKLSSDDEWIF